MTEISRSIPNRYDISSNDILKYVKRNIPEYNSNFNSIIDEYTNTYKKKDIKKPSNGYVIYQSDGEHFFDLLAIQLLHNPIYDCEHILDYHLTNTSNRDYFLWSYEYDVNPRILKYGRQTTKFELLSKISYWYHRMRDKYNYPIHSLYKRYNKEEILERHKEYREK